MKKIILITALTLIVNLTFSQSRLSVGIANTGNFYGCTYSVTVYVQQVNTITGLRSSLIPVTHTIAEGQTAKYGFSAAANNTIDASTLSFTIVCNAYTFNYGWGTGNPVSQPKFFTGYCGSLSGIGTYVNPLGNYQWEISATVGTGGRNHITISDHSDNKGSTTEIKQPERSLTTIDANTEITNTQINLFPNPTADNTNISLHLSRLSSVQIAAYSVTGALVTKKDLGSLSGENSLVLDMSNYHSGMYFVNVTVDGKTSMFKLIKQ